MRGEGEWGCEVERGVERGDVRRVDGVTRRWSGKR